LTAGLNRVNNSLSALLKAEELNMAKTKPPTNARVQGFAELLRKAPKHEEIIPRTRLAGWLYQTDRQDEFILRTNDGSSYELHAKDVGQFTLLHESESKIAVQIELGLDTASRGALRAAQSSGLLGTAFPPAPVIPNRADELRSDEAASSKVSQSAIDPFELRDSQTNPFEALGPAVQVTTLSDPFFTNREPVKPRL
jgi:hypothetical protein